VCVCVCLNNEKTKGDIDIKIENKILFSLIFQFFFPFNLDEFF